MKIYKAIIPLTILIILLTSGCSEDSESNNDNNESKESSIQITKEQFDSNNMELGELTLQFFEETVTCNGNIVAPNNGVAQISSQLSGIVETINYTIDSYVNKGDVLCLLSSHDLIIIQQDYLETSANLERLKIEYQRSKALFEENIGAEKEFKSKESLYKAAFAKCESLKLQLELLNIDIQRIIDGEQYSSFPIIAPISGYITEINIVLAQFVEPQTQLFEIIDTKKLQLQLSIFENDISNIAIGQSLYFSLLGESSKTHPATIISIGKTINTQSKTVQCIASIDTKSNDVFTVGSFIESHIQIYKKESMALPNGAIIKSGNKYSVLVVDNFDDSNYYLRKEPVQIGIKSTEYTEILNKNKLTKVLTKGGYNLSPE